MKHNKVDAPQVYSLNNYYLIPMVLLKESYENASRKLDTE